MIFLNKEYSYLSKTSNKQGIISNKLTGNYVHMPIECYEAIKYASEKNIDLYKMTKIFEDLEDQKYYLNILEILKKILVISEKKYNKLKINYIDKIEISLTNRCNMRCGYCCVESENSKEFDEMSFEEIKNMVDIILKYLKPKTISLSGGEIFIRDDIYEIISYIKNKFNGILIISTNGTLIKEEKIDFLVNNIDSINISLDGYDEETVSKERGKDNFGKIIKLVNNFATRNYHKIGLSLVVSKHTEGYIENFKKLTSDLNVHTVLREFISLGRGKEKSVYLEDCKDVKLFKKTINEPDLSYKKTIACNAGIMSIFINYDGNIFMCPLLQDETMKICNISEVDETFLKKISNKKFEAYKNLEKIKTKEIEHCRNCEYKLFCCTCPAEFNSIYQDKNRLEHNCKKFKKEFELYEPII